MRKRLARRGFTLIELLVVIVIIGILMSLMIVGLGAARRLVQERAVITEIGNLTSAMQNYKSETNGYPPCMGDSYVNTNDVSNGRAARLLQHLRLAFPRYNPGAYSTLKSTIASNYNYLNNGTATTLNLDLLDQAEALVFWLGGPPTPYVNGLPVTSRKLFGFHTNPQNPFQRDTATGSNAAAIAAQYRMSPGKYYDFDDSRLFDYDGDGWLEYVPNLSGDMVAPYVYFDAALYGQGSWGRGTAPTGTLLIPPYTGYPSSSPTLLSQWGLAIPYAAFVDGNNAAAPIQWQNPLNFQIMCAGIDGQYGSAASTAVRIPVFPNTATFRGAGFGSQGTYDEEEIDNLTNFADRAIGNVSTN